jgi:hypothetical protein
MSIVIQLEQGKIANLRVEDLKEACVNSKLEPIIPADFPNTDPNQIELCPMTLCSTNENGECDVKLFISWLGTDVDGNNLISSGERFMNFKNYNLEGMYTSILAISNKDASSNEAFDMSQLNKDVMGRINNPPMTTQAV